MVTGMPSGGLFSGVRRLLAAEPFFVNSFSAKQNTGKVYLAPPMPGEIQAGAFLACADTITIDTRFQGLRGLFNREGLFFLRATTAARSGEVYFHICGAVVETTVRAGEDLIVDNGHLVAFTEGVDYTIDRVRGSKALVAGGEGLVLRFTGAGKVWRRHASCRLCHPLSHRTCPNGQRDALRPQVKFPQHQLRHLRLF